MRTSHFPLFSLVQNCGPLWVWARLHAQQSWKEASLFTKGKEVIWVSLIKPLTTKEIL